MDCLILGLCALLGCLYFLPVAEAVFCYDCKSVVTSSDDQCGGAFDSDNAYVPMCEGPVCVKLVTGVMSTGTDARHVERYCGTIQHTGGCKTQSNGFTKSTICYCDSDICNAATRSVYAVTSVMLLTAFHIVRWLL